MKTKLLLCSAIASVAMAAQAKTFVFCSEGSPSSFDPPTVTDGTSADAAAFTVFNRLVEFEVGTTKVVPALAESWKISTDKMTYTFKLSPLRDLCD